MSRAPGSTARAFIRRGLLAVAVLAVVAGVAAWFYMRRDLEVRYSSPPERFKYGSIGVESTSPPYLVWEALPEVCPDKLPGGYASLGFLYEPGKDRPIGVTNRTLGFPRAGMNCATCHVGRYRRTPDSEPTIVLGMPAHQLDVQRYVRFLVDCVSDDRFTPETVVAAVARKHTLSMFERLFYKYAIVPGAQSMVRKKRGELDRFFAHPAFGPGRLDGFYNVRASDALVGIADMPSIWNQRAREGTWATTWDGANDSAKESLISATIGAGTTPELLDEAWVAELGAWIHDLPPPRFPFPVHAERASAGRALFDAHCARCHAPGGELTGQVTPIAEVGTDRERYDTFTQELVDHLNTMGAGHSWAFQRFRKSTGYVNPLLDGIWARGPYLHNGSVPSLAELLKPPGSRVDVFIRGYDVIDPENVGFVSAGAEAERVGFRFDTLVQGNGNGGHAYGTSLPEEGKAALIEYLKTL